MENKINSLKENISLLEEDIGKYQDRCTKENNESLERIEDHRKGLDEITNE